jgi:uncharacterized protein (TIGR00290 family)
MAAGIALMDSKKKITVSWSGGKDICYALYTILQSDKFEIAHMHTVLERDSGKVGMHGIDQQLIDIQAGRAGFQLVKGYVGEGPTQTYEAVILSMYQSFREEGITHVLFGDIFLEDLRSYRNRLLAKSGLIPVYPLWGRPTRSLCDEYIKNGFEAVVCAVNETCFNAGLLGKTIDSSFFEDPPTGVDVCGENGEYHSFVCNAPFFSMPIAIALGEVTSQTYAFGVTGSGSVDEIRKARFYYQSLLPLM